MRIFISGCARSGTRLTLNLMKNFADTFVFPRESYVSIFEELATRPEANVVVKRTADAHQHLPGLPSDIRLIHCVRHPVDVLTSSHPATRHLQPFHVLPFRWVAEDDALKELRKRQPQRSICFSRYEDLIANPDATQDKMAKFFGLTPLRKFSEDPDNPIRKTSLRKWETHPEYLTYLYGLPASFLLRLTKFCEEFGYAIPAR